jgi:hypothetical protein
VIDDCPYCQASFSRLVARNVRARKFDEIRALQ